MMMQGAHIFPSQTETQRLDKLLYRPSELYHENAKVTRQHWHNAQRAQRDAVQQLYARHAQRQLQDDCHLIQFGAKRYPTSLQQSLPQAPQNLQQDIGATMRKRRSHRRFSGAALSLSQLSALLFFTYGLTHYEDAQQRQYPRRAVPSGGAIYPLELYALILNVQDIAPGIYHYDAYAHILEHVSIGPLANRLSENLLYEELVHGAAVVMVLSAVFERPRFKYGELSYRLTLLEAGHAGQNLCLSATALGLGACPVAGFVEDGLNDLIGLNGVDETALYLCIIGMTEESAV